MRMGIEKSTAFLSLVIRSASLVMVVPLSSKTPSPARWRQWRSNLPVMFTSWYPNAIRNKALGSSSHQILPRA